MIFEIRVVIFFFIHAIILLCRLLNGIFIASEVKDIHHLLIR